MAADPRELAAYANKVLSKVPTDAPKDSEYGDAYVSVSPGSDSVCASVFLGTVFGLTPSGKYYMPWTTNQTEEDVENDAAWYEELEAELDKYDLSLENGEGDPRDLFAVRYLRDVNESEEQA